MPICLKLSRLALLACALLATTGAVAAEKLTLTGSSTVAPLAAEIAKRFEAQNPGVRVDVQTGGSSRGIADARSGLADIGMSSRALKPDEKTGLAEHLLARDGICFIVHASNPISELSDAQIVGLYSGTLRNWKEVGGRDAPVTVINRAEGRSELELFSSHYKLKPVAIKADLIAGENQQGIKLVSGNPDAIAYMSVGTSEIEVQSGTPIKLLPMSGIPASVKSVAAGAFPLSRPLVLVTGASPSPLARKFLDFALSPAVNDLIRDQAFVPLR